MSGSAANARPRSPPHRLPLSTRTHKPREVERDEKRKERYKEERKGRKRKEKGKEQGKKKKGRRDQNNPFSSLCSSFSFLCLFPFLSVCLAASLHLVVPLTYRVDLRAPRRRLPFHHADRTCAGAQGASSLPGQCRGSGCVIVLRKTPIFVSRTCRQMYRYMQAHA